MTERADRGGWCYGPVLCERRPDGKIDMECVDWAAPEVPCPWTKTVRTTAAASLHGNVHAATHWGSDIGVIKEAEDA